MTNAPQFSAALEEELRFRFDMLCDSANDDGESAPEFNNATIHFLMRDIEGSDMWSAFKRECLDWQLAHGVYRVMSKAEYDSMVTLGPKSKAVTKHRGQLLYFVKHIESAVA